MDKTGTGKTTAQAQNENSPGTGETQAVTYRYQNPRSRLQRLKVQTVNNEPSMTDTSHGNDTDVNKIIARFERTGILPQPTQQPAYADCTPFNRDLTELIGDSEDIQARAKDFIEKWSPQPETPPQNTEQTTPSPTA